MVSLHEQLRTGRSLAESLCSARQAASADPIQHATAMSLLALGAG
jgi:hypothetical protein